MLVLCVGMYRACSTWQYGVAGAILERYRGGQRLGFVEGIHFAEKVDRDRWATDCGVLKAHDAHERFSALLAAHEAVGLYSYRDLRDVVASYQHKTGTSFASLMEHGFVELCLNNDRFWRAQPGMLVQSYDALIADPVEGVRQIAAHLGVPLSAGEAEAIADSLSWDANRRKVESMSAELVAQGATLAASDQSQFDPVSLLHWNHIRPVEPSGRAQEESPGERQRVEHIARVWLVEHGYEVGAEPTAADLEPIPRTSYASGAVDIRLDRLLRGTKATAVDFDAAHPRVGNPTYGLYRRGWRTVNIGTTAASRDGFVAERPTDLNLACCFEPAAADPGADPDSAAEARFAAAVWDDLVGSQPIDPPDLVVFNPATDVARILPALLATGWQPRVFVIDPPLGATMPADWQGQLEGRGYLAVPGVVGPAIYLRGDLLDAVPLLARPLGPEDDYRPAAWGAEVTTLEVRIRDLASPPPAEPARLVTELRAAWQGERDMFQAERDSWQRERDAWQCERDAWLRERDDRQRERDDRQRERDSFHTRLDEAATAARQVVDPGSGPQDHSGGPKQPPGPYPPGALIRSIPGRKIGRKLAGIKALLRRGSWLAGDPSGQSA